MLVALLAQLAIGVLMVWFGIPLFLATAHNAFAALLLLSFINLLYTVKLKQNQ
jgi:heme A synthase